MNRIPERRRPLFVLAASLAVLLVVAGGVLLIGRLTPTPTPTAVPTSSSTASPSANPSTPEGATRAFFAAVVAARRTDEPNLIEPFVTNRASSAYRTIAAFLAGQKESGKASITTRLDLDKVRVEATGDTAQLTATLLEAGYDIDLVGGGPLESPVTLVPRKLTVELRLADGVWKVESFETGASS